MEKLTEYIFFKHENDVIFQIIDQIKGSRVLLLIGQTPL